MEIAIVGGGVAGLAAAIMLARPDRRITVYERFSEPGPVGSGLMLQPTGLSALDRMGLLKAIRARGHVIEKLYGKTAAGRPVFNLRYGDLSKGLHAVAIHRGALHGVLWRAFEQSGADLMAGCRITATEPGPDHRLCPIDEGERRHPAADLVIDASGSGSLLRATVAAGTPRPFTYGALWTTVRDTGIAPGTLAQRYHAARIMVGYLPVGSLEVGGPRLAALFWSLKPANYRDWRLGFAAWREEAVALWPALETAVDQLGDPEQLTLACYDHFAARQVFRGSLVLIGDAAHVTSPQLGQGANQGLVDAVVLADALDACADPADGLARYATLRRRHVFFYQMASALMTPFFQSDSRLAAFFRDHTFDRMRKVPYLRRQMVLTLAGLKTGVFTAKSAAEIVNCASKSRF